MMPMVKTHHKGLIPFKDFPQEIHPERLWVVNKVGPVEGLLIADVGCGSHKTIPEATGVDIRPVTDLLGSLDDLPFESGSVDVIISRHSLEHVLDPIKTLWEWRRALRRGGRVVIVLPDHGAVDTMQPVLSAGQHLHAWDMQSFVNFIALIPWFFAYETEIVLEDWSFGAVLHTV